MTVAFHLQLQAQSRQFVLQSSALDLIGLQQAGDFRCLARLVVGTCRVNLALELVETVIDDDLEVGSHLFALQRNGVIDKPVENRHAVNALGVLHFQADVIVERVGPLRVRQHQVYRVAIECFKALLQALAWALERFEQGRVGPEKAQAGLIGLQLRTHLGQGICRRQLVNFGAVEGIQFIDCRRP